MGQKREFFTPLHTRTRRDYLGRMLDEKVLCMEVASRFGPEYWDGPRRYGYGGYKYDGRWEALARSMVDVYGLGPEARILDAGCGKAHLLYELSKILPGATLVGFDVSAHALADAPEPIRGQLTLMKIQDRFPWPDKHFDLVLSLNTLHNLEIMELSPALAEMERVGRQGYLCVESYRNQQELFNLQCWALTCQSFFSEKAWEWLLSEFGYTGDYEFIFFE